VLPSTRESFTFLGATKVPRSFSQYRDEGPSGMYSVKVNAQ
jgi:hypothetical protein